MYGVHLHTLYPLRTVQVCSDIVLVVLCSSPEYTVRVTIARTNLSIHTRSHNPNPDLRQLTNPAVDTSDGKRKRTPPTSPSRNVVVIDTHVHNRGLSARDSAEGKTYTYIAPNIYVRRTEHMRDSCLIQLQMCIRAHVHNEVSDANFTAM